MCHGLLGLYLHIKLYTYQEVPTTRSEVDVVYELIDVNLMRVFH